MYLVSIIHGSRHSDLEDSIVFIHVDSRGSNKSGAGDVDSSFIGVESITTTSAKGPLGHAIANIIYFQSDIQPFGSLPMG